ncbi:MAG: cytochrome c biogenesis protein CcsA [Candidatus Hydrothermarchaeales archaeon]
MDIGSTITHIIELDVGDHILYASIPVGALALLLLLAGQRFKDRSFDRPVTWLIRVFTLLLAIDYALLTYYFVTTNFSINYVWAFTSKGLPIYYKLAGTLAGQQGTMLFWAFLIAVGGLWLSERKGANKDFIDKTLIVVLFIGLYFVFLTKLDSPFKTIYNLYPDLPKTFIPEDGNSLNPLLIDPWMTIHPMLMFIAYAATTNPFAISVVYLFKSIRGKGEEGLRQLLPHIMLWCRISWLFLTLAIAVGGIWAYQVLGWGGFWAWDPVETAPLIPWLILTGAMHTLVEHRRNKRRYVLLAPTLVAMTFTLVVYATLVTRSGFFESVHAFAAGGVGFYLVALTIIAFVLPIGLAVIRYLVVEDAEERIETSYITKTNIFYLSILIFIILTVISFWGVTFPALTKLFTGKKYGVGLAFFNIWSYPLFIVLLLLGGLCFNYKASTKKKCLTYFTFFSALTIIAAVYRPNEAWNIVDYSAIISPEKPFFYTLVGSISALSIFPPSIYLIYSIVERGIERLRKLKGRNYKIVELSVIVIHASIVLIFIGVVFSSMFDSGFSITVNKASKGVVSQVQGTPYGVQLISYDITKQYEDSNEQKLPPGMSISEFYADLAVQLRDDYLIRGAVGEVVNTEHITYLKLVEGNRELWVAVDRIDAEIPVDTRLVASGFLMADFKSDTLNKTFDLVLFSSNIRSYEEEEKVFSTTQEVRLVVYKGTSKIGEGVARLIQYKNGDAKKVMIDRGLYGDVYVIFTGFSGDSIPLDVKIKPLINLTWLGVILFAVSIIMIIIFDPRYKIK